MSRLVGVSSIGCACLFALASVDPAEEWRPPNPPPVYERLQPPYPPPMPEPPKAVKPPVPTLNITVLRSVKVTACSPEDPIDREYYAKHGYEGGIYGVAADLRKLPRGTLIRVAGYRGGAWHRVDSAGGSIIRRSTRAGRTQIDVKFRTYHSAKQWGSRTLDVEVIYPKNFNEASKALEVK